MLQFLLAAAGPLMKMGLGLYSGSRAAKAQGAAANILAGQAQENADLSRDLGYRYNDDIFNTANTWGQHVADTAEGAATGVETMADRARTDATNAAGSANEFLNPYMQYGQEAGSSLLEFIKNGGYKPTEWQERKPFTAADLEMDPGYQFRLTQGQNALERSSAARGSLRSGGTMQAVTQYGQDMASQEYKNAWDRAMAGRKQDFTEWQGVNDVGLRSADTMLRGATPLIQTGGAAAERAGLNLTGAAQYGGTITTNAANTAGGFRTAGATYQANTQQRALDKVLANIFGWEEKGMGYMTDKSKAQAAGQLGQTSSFLQGLQQAYQGFNDFMGVVNRSYANRGGGVSDGGLGPTGGVSPADIYYGQNPWSFPAPGPAPRVGG